ncbi:uncharacterized protein BYT42DRAFT_100036 [Radiomyces spectabilis]|uniref:uncharacterized protein n=1 Tax=Radiomyces spectabilis TaxID=64574 RepID=UPI0022202769|nr:uncharacterized protein BYT42DRAFT_100036 [Radiomyces spectabilis]KAI8370714.1 hypothetical protein BYT42DRAFT_100036 [Radiomyces spectabilis]
MIGGNHRYADPERATKRKRYKVTRACDVCRRKKTKCDGEQPCIGCVKAHIECHYTSSEFCHHGETITRGPSANSTASTSSLSSTASLLPAIAPKSVHSPVMANNATPSSSESPPALSPTRSCSSMEAIEERLCLIEEVLRSFLKTDHEHLLTLLDRGGPRGGVTSSIVAPRASTGGAPLMTTRTPVHTHADPKCGNAYFHSDMHISTPPPSSHPPSFIAHSHEAGAAYPSTVPAYATNGSIPVLLPEPLRKYRAPAEESTKSEPSPSIQHLLNKTSDPQQQQPRDPPSQPTLTRPSMSRFHSYPSMPSRPLSFSEGKTDPRKPPHDPAYFDQSLSSYNRPASDRMTYGVVNGLTQ